MHYIYLTLFSLILFFASCTSNKETTININSKASSATNGANGACISHRFAQGHADRLYGIDCVTKKHLIIQTGEEGEKLTNSISSRVRIEGSPDFINTVYKTDYHILTNKGDERQNPFLSDLLPKDKTFYGSLDTKYNIVFKPQGNYLVLYKASKNLNDIPYTERTSLVQEGDLYMVPFLGYPIQYCRAEFIRNAQGQETYENRCQKSSPEQAQYVQLLNPDPSEFRYITKKDFFPANYFEGKWFFSQGPIETRKDSTINAIINEHGELKTFPAFLVEVEKIPEALRIKDISGNVRNIEQAIRMHLPVRWVNYKADLNGSQFESFGEKNDTKTYDNVRRPYLEIDFNRLGKEDIINIVISKNYFSFTTYRLVKATKREGEEVEYKLKYKYSFLKEQAVDTEGFVPRRWFVEDVNHHFGSLPISPQDTTKAAEQTEDELWDHFRTVYFNTSLNSEKEKREKTKIIYWYFSKNSSTKPEHRQIVREAIRIWNRAFEIIREGKNHKIRLELVEDEEKELGDLRYNIINLVYNQNTASSGLVGIAPAFSNPNTGQIIGTTTNVILDNNLDFFYKYVRDYIRYEVFQKDTKSPEENEIHVVSPYIRTQIKEFCPHLKNFIQKKKRARLKPYEALNDKELVIECGDKIAQKYILYITLHELGHNFGLSHNFVASTDSKNYYQSKEDLAQYFQREAQKLSTNSPPKSSSVMDYSVRFEDLLTYLGKYDIAALRFLYNQEVETKKGEFLSLNIPEDPSRQQQLNARLLSQMKKYLHCFDTVASHNNRIKENFLCKAFDHGSNPLEITKNNIARIKRGFNNRYSYDSILNRLQTDDFHIALELILFYDKWLDERDKYLQSRQSLEKVIHIKGDEESIEEYLQLLKEGLKSNNQSYKAYYPVRELIPQFFMDFVIFSETMKCRVQNNKSKEIHTLDLEHIKITLVSRYGDTLYVEDCHSKMIADFFTENNVTLIEQFGMENYITYWYQGEKSRANQMDLFAVANILNGGLSLLYLHTLSPEEFKEATGIKRDFSYPDWKISLFREPDIFEKTLSLLEQQILNADFNNSYNDVTKSVSLWNFIPRFWAQQNTHTADQNILIRNLAYFGKIQFRPGTEGGSFYKRVEEPLSKGVRVDEISIPFLTTAYREYENSGSALRFQDYFLSARKDSILDERRDFATLIIPHINNNFIEKIIRQYNENLRRIQEYDQLKNPSLIQQLDRQTTVLHNTFLKDLITSTNN